MENGRLHRFASKRMTAWSKQTLPGWWTMFLVVGGVALFAYYAYSLISGPDQPQGPPPPPSATSGESPGATPSTHATTDPDPGPDASGPSAGQTQVPAPAHERTKVVYGPDGRTVTVPAGSFTVAALAFQALYNAQAADMVPTSSGQAHRPPAETSKGSVTALTWTNAGAGTDRMEFSAIVDPDGDSGNAQPTIAYATIARFDGNWVYLDTAS